MVLPVLFVVGQRLTPKVGEQAECVDKVHAGMESD
jgi:hypothetical protein